MEQKMKQSAAYKGTKNFNQHLVPTANATGFGAATDDFMERGIDLNEQLIMNKPATFFFRMNSTAMENASIHPGDVLVVDRSIKASNGKIIVAAVNGELLVRRYQQNTNGASLCADNKKFKDIELNECIELICWGVVTCTIHLIDNTLIAFNKNKNS